MRKCIAFLPFLPAIGMVTVSFFVAFVASKAESKGLKIYAKIVIVLLWIAALALIVCGIYKFIACGNKVVCPMPGKWQ